MLREKVHGADGVVQVEIRVEMLRLKVIADEVVLVYFPILITDNGVVWHKPEFDCVLIVDTCHCPEAVARFSRQVLLLEDEGYTVCIDITFGID